MVVQKASASGCSRTVGKNTFVRLGRLVPIVGGVIGAGLDAWMQHRVADERQAGVPDPPDAAGLTGRLAPSRPPVAPEQVAPRA